MSNTHWNARTGKRRAQVWLAAALLVGSATSLAAQSAFTENTLTLDDPARRPPTALAEVAWLAGTWTGTGLGGTAEETWAHPSAGTMVGLFKLIDGESPRFYEMAWIVEEAGSLALKLKHFHADLTGWEERDDYIEFPLVRVTDDAIFFDGLTYRREGTDRMVAYVAIRHSGEIREERLTFRRVAQ